MASFSEILERLHAPRITEIEIRAEAFALGVRHRGEVLEGAQAEAKAPSLTLRRAMLLRAVIRSQVR